MAAYSGVIPPSLLKPFLPGVLFALISILFGFGLGGLFGSIEGTIKDSLNYRADLVIDTVYKGDLDKKEAVLAKSWSYMKRAHLHGGAIGAVALSVSLLLILLGNAGRLETLSSTALGLGALLYSVFWLLAAFAAPGLGSTSAAKEALIYIAVPGAGLSILGLLGSLVAVLKAYCRKPSRN